ncbi:MAG: hypothetical protein RDU30_09905 [Desulfovibrionaceae bacterium]|nr:hypothetical protein [Desulfovibrionaceae bacterium]
MSAITLAGLTLPPDLIWSNEHAAPLVGRTSRRTIGGGMVVQDTALSGGRPIDLTGEDGWCAKSLVDTLYAWASTPGWTGLLTLHDGRQFCVRFRFGDESPVSAISIMGEADPDADSLYNLNLRLETV